MNALGQALVWCALQVTLVAAVAGLAYAALGRRGPAVRSLVALTGLSVSVGLTFAAFSPWPRWPVGTLSAHDTTRDAADVFGATTSRAGSRGPARSGATQQELGTAAPAALDPTAVETARSFWRALVDELERRPAATPESAGWNWTGILAVLFGGGFALGVLRLAAASLAVGTYRRHSRPIAEPAVLELLSQLCAELSCRRDVELRESRRLVSAAMLGWRRPLVLLPAEWTEWSEPELRAVLAHEIAHASRGDFAAWVCAQVGLILHFYHPLVHWLAARLRLDQELAADAAAARVSGGRQPYLRILADMALRQSDRGVGWPARAFLPTRRTFLRRIEMLRATKQVPGAASRRLSAVTVGVLVLAGLAAAGLRGSSGETASGAAQVQNNDARQAQPPGRRAPRRDVGESASSTLYTAYVPSEAQGFLFVRPAALLARPEMQPFASLLAGPDGRPAAPITGGLSLTDIDQLSLMLIPPVRPTYRPPGSLAPFGAMTIRMTKPHDFRKLLEDYAPDAVRVPVGDREFFSSTTERDRCYFRPDDRTLILGSMQDIARVVGTGPETGWKRLAAGPARQSIEGAHYAVVVDSSLIQSLLKQADGELRQQVEGGRTVLRPAAAQAAQLKLMLSAYAPLWQQTQTITFSATLGDRLSLTWLFDSENEANAQAVRRTIDALLTLGRNMSTSAAEMLRDQAAGQPAEPLLAAVLKLGQELLDKAELEQDGTQVRLATSGSLGGTEANAVAALTESVKAVRAAARRTQSMNSLKQIAIAFHNYHDTYGRFPPAVLYGPDGKTPHSWRVAILPYVEGAPLYNQYRFNEPWDSPHNRKILEQMPPVYRHPDAPADSTNAAYFALVGEQTDFTGEKAARNEAGIRLLDISDGTSNTLMVVEAKRDIPWSKPEDIPFDPEKELPTLGGYTPGGFNAALCDGSVRFISDMADAAVLKAVITRAGREPVNFEDLQPRR